MTCSLNIGLLESSFKAIDRLIWLLFKVGIVLIFRSVSFSFEEIKIGEHRAPSLTDEEIKLYNENYRKDHSF